MAQENLIKASSNPYTIYPRRPSSSKFVKAIADYSTEGNKVRLPSALNPAYGSGRCGQCGGPGRDQRAGKWHG